MDGNSAKKAPILDHLVDTSDAAASQKTASSTLGQDTKKNTSKPVLASMNGTYTKQSSNPQVENIPQNRRTDKSEFEIELTKTVNRIMLRHFEHASEEIVQQVLSEVRARLPGRKKD